MRRFAHISDGIVVNISVWAFDPADGSLVDVTGIHVVIGMTYEGGYFDG